MMQYCTVTDSVYLTPDILHGNISGRKWEPLPNKKIVRQAFACGVTQ